MVNSVPSPSSPNIDGFAPARVLKPGRSDVQGLIKHCSDVSQDITVWKGFKKTAAVFFIGSAIGAVFTGGLLGLSALVAAYSYIKAAKAKSESLEDVAVQLAHINHMLEHPPSPLTDTQRTSLEALQKKFNKIIEDATTTQGLFTDSSAEGLRERGERNFERDYFRDAQH